MADLAKELEDLHATVIRAVRERMEESADGEDIRLALQLLKQNSITASMAEADTQSLKSKMAGKLNFSALQEKIVPIRPPSPVAHPRANDEAQQA